jgi:MMP 1-O-methyltransferase
MHSIFQLAETVKGFLDPEEGRRLYETASLAAVHGPCLEIGSYCGKSTLYLGEACRRKGSVLFSIDHHQGSEEQQPGEEYFDPDLFDPATYGVNTLRSFRRTLELAGLLDTVVALVCTSVTAARAWATPLSLVFIDGGHALETVLRDYHDWAGHIQPGGYLLIHDIFRDPALGGQAPYQIYQMAVASGAFTELPLTKSLGVLRRNG